MSLNFVNINYGFRIKLYYRKGLIFHFSDCNHSITIKDDFLPIIKIKKILNQKQIEPMRKNAPENLMDHKSSKSFKSLSRRWFKR